jgi:uncharacterized protein YdeI (YjbR/CyaY-like superfamily)
MQPTYFRSPTDFRRWLEKNHAKTAELYVGFHKKATGEPSLTYPEALDEALCFGWIDGVRKSVDDGRYTIRFTPRKPGSKWSAVNIKKAEALKAAGRMAPAGLAAFDGRNPERAGYSFEERPSAFDPDLEARFRENSKAWEFFQAQPPGYRRIGIWYVLSAKKEETRRRRLERLIGDSEKGVRLPMMTTTAKKGA